MSESITIKSRKHAAFLLSTAEARKVKQEEALAETIAAIAHYAELVQTLPEVAEAVVTKIEPKSVVEFGFGRGETRKTLTGTVKARKDDENGKPEGYKIEVGEGFDAVLYTVQPGAITNVVATPDAE